MELICMIQPKYANGHFNLTDFFTAVRNSHSSDIKIGQPDTQNSFDVKFKFYPFDGDGMNIEQTQKSIKDKLSNDLQNDKKTFDNTKGLVDSSDSFKRDNFKVTYADNNAVIVAHDQFKTCKSATSSSSFIEYLVQANKLIGITNSWKNSDDIMLPGLNINLTYYVQDLTIPNIKSNGEGECVTPYLGSFPVNGTFVTPAEHRMSLNILNTRVPLLERVFYPWLRETTLPYWSYTTQPFTTATIEVDMRHHTDVRYIFYGCRPCEITTIQPSQDTPSDFVRQVTFAFDWMFVLSDLTVGDYDGKVENNVQIKTLEEQIKQEKRDEAKIQNSVMQWANKRAEADQKTSKEAQTKIVDNSENQKEIEEQKKANEKQKQDFENNF